MVKKYYVVDEETGTILYEKRMASRIIITMSKIILFPIWLLMHIWDKIADWMTTKIGEDYN